VAKIRKLFSKTDLHAVFKKPGDTTERASAKAFSRPQQSWFEAGMNFQVTEQDFLQVTSAVHQALMNVKENLKKSLRAQLGWEVLV